MSAASAHEYTVDGNITERQYVISGDGLRLLTRSTVDTSTTADRLTSITIAP